MLNCEIWKGKADKQELTLLNTLKKVWWEWNHQISLCTIFLPCACRSLLPPQWAVKGSSKLLISFNFYTAFYNPKVTRKQWKTYNLRIITPTSSGSKRNSLHSKSVWLGSQTSPAWVKCAVIYAERSIHCSNPCSGSSLRSLSLFQRIAQSFWAIFQRMNWGGGGNGTRSCSTPWCLGHPCCCPPGGSSGNKGTWIAPGACCLETLTMSADGLFIQ